MSMSIMESCIFSSRKREARLARIDAKYSVDDCGVVWSSGMPLAAIGGVGVNLHGKRVKVAYLVARAFVPNSECRKYVRHKNGDVSDNRAENLEWSDEEEVGRRGRKPGVRWCKAIRPDGEVAGIWRSASEAGVACGVRVEAIRACLNGRQKMAGGMFWEDL